MKNIALVAQNAYIKAQETPKIQDNSYTEAVKFQDVFKANFNKFANMTPDQILSHVRNSKSYVASQDTSSIDIKSIVKEARQTVQNQEKVTAKFVLGEASLASLLSATTESTNTLSTMVTVQRKFLDAYDKVMNMSV